MTATLLHEVREECADLSDRQVDERLRAIEERRRRIEAELAATLSVAESRGLYTADAHRSMRGYCRATMNWSGPETTFWVRAERLVREHPAIGDAWSAGRLSSSHVRLLVQLHVDSRTRDRLGEFVPQLLQNAEELSYPDFAKVVERLVALAEQETPIGEQGPQEARTALAVDVQGSLEVRASGGDPIATAEFLAILGRFIDAEFRRDVESGSMRTSGQRRFDALLAMARTAASNGGLVKRSDPLVSVVVDERTFADVLLHSGLAAGTSLTGDAIDPFTGLPRPADAIDDLLANPDDFLSRRCETTNGVQLRPVDVLRAALSGHVRRMVLGAKSVPIDLGRSARLFTGPARDAAKLLMRWCDHPGCDLPADWCQVDHSIEWLDDGRTDQDNAGSECGFHNRAKHRKRLRTRRGTNGRMYTHRSDGSIILPVGARPPRFDRGDDDDPEHQRRFRIEATCHLLRVRFGPMNSPRAA